MKENIHPVYKASKATCACGNTWETRSTTPTLHLDICANCHPFFTGKQKLIDTEGRIDRFNKKYGKRAGAAAPAAEPTAAPKE
jgi:large subunit ribosomal protein L31